MFWTHIDDNLSYIYLFFEVVAISEEQGDQICFVCLDEDHYHADHFDEDHNKIHDIHEMCAVHRDADQVEIHSVHCDRFENKKVSQAGCKDSFEKQLTTKAGHDLSRPQSYIRDSLFWIPSILLWGPG